jgi:hypothetical protein
MQEKVFRVAVDVPLKNPKHWQRICEVFELRRVIPSPASTLIDGPRPAIYNYWQPNIVKRMDDCGFYPEYESLTVIFLCEQRARGHIFLNFGNVRTWSPCCRKFIRAAVFSAADAVIIIHKVRGNKPTIAPEHWAFKHSITQAADPFAVSVDYILMGNSAFQTLLDPDYSSLAGQRRA